MAKQKIGKVYLYGDISAWGDNSAAEFISRFDAVAIKSDRIVLHVHCPGGDVFEGNMIYNKILQSSKIVDVQIDGLAASMASIIIMAAKKITMAKNAFVMIHAPSAFSYGNADKMESAAKLLRSMEAQFIETYSRRTGKAADEVKDWLQGDNWFSAQEAKDENLVNEVVEAVDMEAVSVQSGEAGLKDIYHKYEEFKSKINDKSKITKKDKSMNEILKALGLVDGTSESAAVAAIEKLQTRAKRADDLEDQIKAETRQAITAMVEKAVADKRITADKKDVFVKIGESSGIEALKAALEAAAPVPNITAALTGSQAAASIEITAAQWDKMDKDGSLKALKATDPDTYQKLFDVKFNKKQEKKK